MNHHERVSRIAKALAHPARVRMLRMLEEGERCGCEFAPVLSLDPSVVSRYLAALARAGLVSCRRDGVRVMWQLAHPEISQILQELEELSSEKDSLK